MSTHFPLLIEHAGAVAREKEHTSLGMLLIDLKEKQEARWEDGEKMADRLYLISQSIKSYHVL